MNNNIPAQTEQPITQTPNIEDLNRAFADACFMWSCILNHATDNTDPENNRFKWLSERAGTLADVAMQMHTGGAK